MKHITVKDLHSILTEVENHRVIVVAQDTEGNGYYTLLQCEVGMCSKPTVSGRVDDVGPEKLSEEERVEGFTEADLIPDGIPALILRPCHG